MDPVSLDTLILDGGLRWVNFFNGRLLTKEDMTREQDANRDSRKRLGLALGEGIVQGLEVLPPAKQGENTPEGLVVTVNKGLAVNRLGETLWLAQDTQLSLANLPQISPQGGGNITFAPCIPARPGAFTGPGLYLLVISPGAIVEGSAPVSGLGNLTAPCSDKYKVDAVQFRMIPLNMTEQLGLGSDEIDDAAHLRSRMAYAFFVEFARRRARANPLQAPPVVIDPLGALRPERLTECDVPLALVYLTDADGLQFVELWSARRRLAQPSAISTAGPPPNAFAARLGDPGRSEAEAIFLQFQAHLSQILGGSGAPNLRAEDNFVYLPPAGFLPLGSTGVDWAKFLGPHAPSAPTPVDAGLLRGLLSEALDLDPFPVNSSPYAPLRVYQAQGNPDFVLFARSPRGRIRVFPASGQAGSLAVAARAENSNLEVKAGSLQGNHFALEELEPGDYQIALTLAGSSTPILITTRAIGGQTNDLFTGPLQAPTQERAEAQVMAVDSSRESLGSAVKTINAKSDKGIEIAGVYDPNQDVWVFAGLEPGIYQFEALASGFQPGQLKDVNVAPGAKLDLTITLQPQGERRTPSRCVGMSRLEDLRVPNVRLCMLFHPDRLFPGEDYKGYPVVTPVSVTRNGTVTVEAANFPPEEQVQVKMGLLSSLGIDGDLVDALDSGAGGTSVMTFNLPSSLFNQEALALRLEFPRLRYTAFTAFPNETTNNPRVDFPLTRGMVRRAVGTRELLIGEVPWSGMPPLQDPEPDVIRWLLAWQKFLEEANFGVVVEDRVPRLYVNPDFSFPRDLAEIPTYPQAFAAFGALGIPVTLVPGLDLRQDPIPLEQVIQVFPQVELEALMAGGFVYLEQLAGAWVDIVARLTGIDQEEQVRELIFAAIKEISS